MFVLFGDGPQRTELEQLVDKLGIKKYVLFPGFLKDIQTAYFLYATRNIDDLTL